MIHQTRSFFHWSGISVASGIPDFRSVGGLYDEISKNGFSPEYLLSDDYLKAILLDLLILSSISTICRQKPNSVHQWIAQLEQDKRSLGVITQNIDGLHRVFGGTHVDELHGTLNRFYCTHCNHEYSKMLLSIKIYAFVKHAVSQSDQTSYFMEKCSIKVLYSMHYIKSSPQIH